VSLSTFINQLIIGLGLGCVYGLIGLSFNGIYDATKIVNFAQGEFAMVGAVMASVAMYDWHLRLVLVVPVFVVTAILCALALQFLIVEPLLKRSAGLIAVIIGTMAVALMIQGTFGWWVGFGPLRTATYVDPISLKWGEIVVAKEYAIIIAITAVLTALYWLFLERTRWGGALRATGQNAVGAVGVGIPAVRIRSLAFAISANVAAVAGFLIGPLVGVNVFLGFDLLIYGFVASVIGGIGRPYAALVGGIVLGMSTSYMGTYESYLVTPTNMALLVLVLLVRPNGLFSSTPSARLN
jgi:branched-chain amino acid transport system permease protein